MKKILFVNPSSRATVFGKMKTLALPPMGLGTLASRTPYDYAVSIVDENVETLDFDTAADLVAVTSTTPQAPRAYEILGEFRRRGVPTILGGIHASVLPDEAARYADTVVIGEADDLWTGILDDFDQGALRSTYRAGFFPSLENQPRMRRELFAKKYFVQTVQTSRGCPCDCNFCSVTSFNGRRYRFRPVREVIDELAHLRENRIFISDDSIVGLGHRCTEHAIQLFEGMRGLGKSWGSQVCITIAEHDELLRAAAAAGANTVYIGFESVDSAGLESMDKHVNLRPAIRNFKDAIKKLHDHGIGVIGGFILGSDGDTPDIFDKTIDFIGETAIDGCQFTLMTPFPGTRLFEQMQRENRLLYTDFPNDWARYHCYDAVIRPRHMTVEQLQRGQRHVYRATSTMSKSLTRGVRTLWNTGSPVNALTNFFWNYGSYRALDHHGSASAL
ncbi:MAG: radical SAM protein [bacterium]